MRCGVARIRIPAPAYPFAKFQEDWGPKSEHANESVAHIGLSQSCGRGVLIRLDYRPPRNRFRCGWSATAGPSVSRRGPNVRAGICISERGSSRFLAAANRAKTGLGFGDWGPGTAQSIRSPLRSMNLHNATVPEAPTPNPQPRLARQAPSTGSRRLAARTAPRSGRPAPPTAGACPARPARHRPKPKFGRPCERSRSDARSAPPCGRG